MDTYTDILKKERELPLGATAAYKKYGIAKSKAYYTMHNSFSIPLNLQPIFPTYYLLHWEVSYFRSLVQLGTIERAGIVYQIIYYRTDPIAIAKAKSPADSVLVSFRTLAKEYGAIPTVLVKLGTVKKEEKKEDI